MYTSLIQSFEDIIFFDSSTLINDSRITNLKHILDDKIVKYIKKSLLEWQFSYLN